MQKPCVTIHRERECTHKSCNPSVGKGARQQYRVARKKITVSKSSYRRWQVTGGELIEMNLVRGDFVRKNNKNNVFE